ncbi:MAG: glycosyltransferase family 4 protein [Phenylobacterium sp.]
MADRPSDAVLRFEPDAYDPNSRQMVGRLSAGQGFLRAAVQGRGDGPVFGYTPLATSAAMFAEMVRELDPAAEPDWIQGEQLQRIGPARGVLYLADPALTHFARVRLRAGPASYSLCGVTHTLSTHAAQQFVAELLSEPVTPWDALICTSSAALRTVETVLDAQAEFLRWRFRTDLSLTRPLLPVIPLGVHCADFDFDDAARAAAREALNIGADEVVALYVGRLLFAGKAHPYPIFHSLQAARARTGRKLTLILCGRAPDEAIETAYLAGAARYAPDVRLITVDSRDDAARFGAWAAGDLFVSFADGVQETFGLTPVEAMAAGLPAVVSDYNGYRDTVRDGIDGFRIATWAPQPGLAGEAYALRQELNILSYPNYGWATASTTSVDLQALDERIVALVEQPELRRRLGAAGKARAREVFDWPVVFGQYRQLWGEQNARRAAAAADPDLAAWARGAPRTPPSRLDPYRAFAHHPTALIGPDTLVALAAGATLDDYRGRCADGLFPYGNVPEAAVLPMWSRLQAGACPVAGLAQVASLSPDWAVIVVATLAKMGLVALSAESPEAR